ncbi:XamI family restriction endonuclease [Streptomyces albidoflavus]|uniref:XamI family restriction endonuclease n=1 Tax=Streptomyces albidoflavus TaxID=1886 RepID=UPI000FF57C74|nr:XamI family restriction endonuclease [Streptomyces albidoflavus]RWZ76903.1 XamI family restriction endonuclease [Streptomyces albidoflavus]
MPQPKPPTWSLTELEQQRQASTELFRHERTSEPLEQYLSQYEVSKAAIDTILEMTVDLETVTESAAEILGDVDLADVARYLASPPISNDDLRTIADTTTTPSKVKKNLESAQNLMNVILMGLDRERFPWVGEGRQASEAERNTAAVSTAAMHAFRWVETWRRHNGKRTQESAVKSFLAQKCGFTEVATRKVLNITQAPAPGEFCGEALVGTRKADIIIRLHDGRLMPIECKVSNSETNSYKRINNDAAVKAVVWTNEFGSVNVVPAAMLSGVFALNNLGYAQEKGLYLLWAHEMEPLKEFLEVAQ